MNLYSVEPEYSVEESQETHHMESGLLEGKEDWSQVVVDMQELSKALSICTDILRIVHIDMAKLVQSLREQE